MLAIFDCQLTRLVRRPSSQYSSTNLIIPVSYTVHSWILKIEGCSIVRNRSNFLLISPSWDCWKLNLRTTKCFFKEGANTKLVLSESYRTISYSLTLFISLMIKYNCLYLTITWSIKICRTSIGSAWPLWHLVEWLSSTTHFLEAYRPNRADNLHSCSSRSLSQQCSRLPSCYSRSVPVQQISCASLWSTRISLGPRRLFCGPCWHLQ